MEAAAAHIGAVALERADLDAQLVALGIAIGHPVRLRLLRALADAERPASASALAHLVGDEMSSVTSQLRKLEQLGIVDQTGVRRHHRIPVRRYVLTDVGRYILERAGVL